MNARLI